MAAPAPAAEPKVAAPPADQAQKKKKAKPAVAKKGKKSAVKFTINCTAPVADEIFDIASFEKFLHDKIKVNGKTGKLGELVTIERDANSIHVTTKTDMAKRYLKYLTKKFLKKQQLRDYIRVIASNKNGYDLRYFNINDEEEEAGAGDK